MRTLTRLRCTARFGGHTGAVDFVEILAFAGTLGDSVGAGSMETLSPKRSQSAGGVARILVRELA
jgi:hypothetical protein